VTTVLQYLVIAAVIGLVVFALAVFVFGRGEQLAPLSPRGSPTELPDREMTADDVRTVRFAMALRGYRMSDVDWALDRMADEVDRLRGRIAALSGPSPSREPASGEPLPPDSSSGEDSSSVAPDLSGAGEPGEGSTDSASDVDPSLAGVAKGAAGRHLRSGSDTAVGDHQTDVGTTSGDTS